jgi:hypothetical protein
MLLAPRTYREHGSEFVTIEVFSAMPAMRGVVAGWAIYLDFLTDVA